MFASGPTLTSATAQRNLAAARAVGAVVLPVALFGVLTPLLFGALVAALSTPA